MDRHHRVLGNPFVLDDEGDTTLRNAVCDAYDTLVAKQQYDAVVVRETAARIGVLVKPGFGSITGG